MVLHVKRKELLSIATQVARAVSKTNTKPEIAGIHLEGDSERNMITLTATNHEVVMRASIPATVEAGGSAIVPPELLLGIFSKMPEETVTLEARGEHRLFAASGEAQFEVAVLPGESYPMPELPFPQDTVSISGIRSLVTRTAFAAVRGQPQGTQGCIKLELKSDGVRAFACNGVSLVQTNGDQDCRGNTTLLIPATSLALLASVSRDEDVFEMGLTGTSVVFWDGTLFFSARVMEGSFLDTDRIFAESQPCYTMQVNAKELTEAVRAVSTLAGSHEPMELAFRGHELMLRCQNTRGEAAKAVPALLASLPERPFYLNPHNLLGYLRLLEGTVNLSFTKEGHLIAETGGLRYLQMAMRPPREKKGTPEKASPKAA